MGPSRRPRKDRRPPKDQSYWENYVYGSRMSDLSQKDYCTVNGLSPRTLRFHIAKMRASESAEERVRDIVVNMIEQLTSVLTRFFPVGSEPSVAEPTQSEASVARDSEPGVSADTRPDPTPNLPPACVEAMESPIATADDESSRSEAVDTSQRRGRFIWDLDDE